LKAGCPMLLNRVFPQLGLPEAPAKAAALPQFRFHEEAEEELTGKKKEPVPIILQGVKLRRKCGIGFF